MPGSVSTTTVVRGPISLTATRECGSPEPYHFCFYFHLQCVHRSHTYAAPRVGGQAGQSCHRHPQPSPGARAGADKGSRQHPDTVKLSQGFKTDVIGGLGKKKKGFLSHFRSNTRRAAHRLKEWDILLSRGKLM